MNLLDEFFMPFERTIVETKEELVKQEGTCSDLFPTFTAARSSDLRSVMGVCNNTLERGTTRWPNLCRQVVTLTGADIALAAVEVMLTRMDDGEQIEGIEISAVTKDETITTIRPYKYGLGRFVDWQPTVNADIRIQSTTIEIEAARQAWLREHVAYPASIKYLSGFCDANWRGHPTLLSALLGEEPPRPSAAN